MPPVHTSKAIMIIYIADKLQKKKNQFWAPNEIIIKQAQRKLKQVYLRLREFSIKKHYRWVPDKFYKKIKL
jgi:HD superfamily phosphohydrolase YqeK